MAFSAAVALAFDHCARSRRGTEVSSRVARGGTHRRRARRGRRARSGRAGVRRHRVHPPLLSRRRRRRRAFDEIQRPAVGVHAGRELRLAHFAPQPRIHRRFAPDACARHRRKHGDLQRCPRRAFPPVAVRVTRAAGCGLREQHQEQRTAERTLSGRLRRLPRPAAHADRTRRIWLWWRNVSRRELGSRRVLRTSRHDRSVRRAAGWPIPGPTFSPG